MTLVMLEPVAPPSRVKLSTTEPLQREGQALQNAGEGVQSIKTCSRSRSYNIFKCSTQLSMEFIIYTVHKRKEMLALKQYIQSRRVSPCKQENIYVQVNIFVFMGSWTYNVAARFFRNSKVNVQICARF